MVPTKVKRLSEEVTVSALAEAEILSVVPTAQDASVQADQYMDLFALKQIPRLIQAEIKKGNKFVRLRYPLSANGRKILVQKGYDVHEYDSEYGRYTVVAFNHF